VFPAAMASAMEVANIAMRIVWSFGSITFSIEVSRELQFVGAGTGVSVRRTPD
jgi:hypothetical protein